MATPARHTLLCAAALAAVIMLSGCATRYDASGKQIFVWQFGQNTDASVDYSNPRLPVLPRSRPLDNQLWEIPSPYEFNDLSRWSMLRPLPDQDGPTIRVGDNARCADSCVSTAPGAPLAVRADARGERSPLPN